MQQQQNFADFNQRIVAITDFLSNQLLPLYQTPPHLKTQELQLAKVKSLAEVMNKYLPNLPLDQFISRLGGCREWLVANHEYARWPEAPMLIASCAAANQKHQLAESGADITTRRKLTPIEVAAERMINQEEVGGGYVWSGAQYSELKKLGVTLQNYKGYWSWTTAALIKQYGEGKADPWIQRNLDMMELTDSDGQSFPKEYKDTALRGIAYAREHWRSAPNL